jgi:tetratricopeptide (TPR) repeat protein
MKKIIAGALSLSALAMAGILANQAVDRDRQYHQLILEGDEALSRGQTFIAIEKFSGAIALKPDSMLAYLKRGDAHQKRGGSPDTLTAALRDLRTAVALDPGATRTLEELGDVNFQLQRYANAAENYEAYLRLDDRSATVLYKLGLASRGAGRLTRAISSLQQSIALAPAFHEAHYVLGLCFKDRDQLEAARAAFTQAVRVSPAFIPAREELADLHRIQDRARNEIEELEALAALDPAKAERQVAVGLAYLRAGNTEQAVTKLREAAGRFPEHTAVYAALGRVWVDAAEESGEPSDVRKAIEALEPVATQSTASSYTLGLYARALMIAGRQAEAIQVFKQASERFPVDPEVLTRYASVARRRGHLDEARRALISYSLLVDDDREKAAQAERIADLSMALNDASAAVEWYRKSVSRATADASLLARLADAQARTGEIDAARVTAQRAIDADPSDPTALAVAHRLQAR